MIVSPTGRRPVGGALAPVADLSLGIWDSIGSGVVVHASPVWGLAGKAWRSRLGEEMLGLDLLGCDPGPGTAARVFNTRETEVAYGSLRLRDGVRAASPSSPVVCRIVGAPPLCAPAWVIPGRTLWEGEGRAGSRASPQLQGTPFVRWRWPAGVPVPVPPESQSVPIQSWWHFWLIRSAMVAAASGTWKRLRKARVRLSSRGRGRARRALWRCWIVSASRSTWPRSAGADGCGVGAVVWVRP